MSERFSFMRTVAIAAPICAAGTFAALYWVHWNQDEAANERGTAEPSACVATTQIVEGGSALVLRVPEGVAAPVADPRDPAYNPIALQDVGMNVYDIFEREPTDPEWSSQMQARIEKQLGEDIKILAPSAKNVAVVCHWATCKISAEVGQSDASMARAALTVAQFGDRTSFSKKSHELTRDGVVRESAIVLFHAERDLDVQAASYQKKRDAFMLHMPPNDPLYGPVVRHNLSK